MAPSFGWRGWTPRFRLADAARQQGRRRSPGWKRPMCPGLEGSRRRDHPRPLRRSSIRTPCARCRAVGRSPPATSSLRRAARIRSCPTCRARNWASSPTQAFDLPALPRSILIEGGGYVGVEFATIFAGLGVRDHADLSHGTLRAARLRRGSAAGPRHRARRLRGIRRIYETNVRGAAPRTMANIIVAASATWHRGAVRLAMMFATGREEPNVNGVRPCQEAGVQLRPDGAIRGRQVLRAPRCPRSMPLAMVTGRTAAHAGRDPRGAGGGRNAV